MAVTIDVMKPTTLAFVAPGMADVGLAAGMTKLGGVLITALVAAAVAAPSVRVTAFLGAAPLAVATLLAVVVAVETRRRRLEEITSDELRTVDA